MVPDYAKRAQARAPQTAEELRDAARAMLRDGLGEYTVAEALQLDVHAVRRLIGERAWCAE